MERKPIEISWGSLWRILGFAIFSYALFSGAQIFLALFASIVISAGLDFIVDYLEKKRIPRTLAVILVFLAIILAIVALIYLIIPYIIADLSTVLINLNKSQIGSFLGPLFDLKATQTLGTLINNISASLWGGGSPVDTISAILGSVGLAFAVVIIAFYLAISRDGVERFIRAVFPFEYESAALSIYDKSRKKIGSWFRTQLFASAIMGFLVWGSLSIIGLKHAFLVSIFAAVFELIPFIGPILAGAIAFIFAFTDSPTLAFSTLIIFLVLHQLESHVLVPLLTRRSVGLHPVIVIFALLLGIEFGGFLGAVVAVPLAAVLQEVVEHRVIRRSPVPEYNEQ